MDKTTILNLIRKYYELGQTVKDTLIMGRGTKQVVRMMVTRTAIAWEIKGRDGEYSDEKTEEHLEKERNRIAGQVYRGTLRILKWKQGKTGEDYSEIDNRTDLTEHEEMMDFSIGALYCLEVISPYDIMYIAPLEREGISYGFKREPEVKETKEDKAFKELGETEKEFEE